MNPTAMINLLLDGAQVFIENIKIISILIVNLLGIGILLFKVVDSRQSNSEQNPDAAAMWSLGICGFVLASYAIVAISKIWHEALPILSSGLLLAALLAFAAGFLHRIKKKICLFHGADSSHPLSFSR